MNVKPGCKQSVMHDTVDSWEASNGGCCWSSKGHDDDFGGMWNERTTLKEDDMRTVLANHDDFCNESTC